MRAIEREVLLAQRQAIADEMTRQQEALHAKTQEEIERRRGASRPISKPTRTVKLPIPRYRKRVVADSSSIQRFPITGRNDRSDQNARRY